MAWYFLCIRVWNYHQVFVEDYFTGTPTPVSSGHETCKSTRRSSFSSCGCPMCVESWKSALELCWNETACWWDRGSRSSVGSRQRCYIFDIIIVKIFDGLESLVIYGTRRGDVLHIFVVGSRFVRVQAQCNVEVTKLTMKRFLYLLLKLPGMIASPTLFP